MGKLGDLFPEDEKRKFIDRHLRPGQVLYLHCRFTNPQKDKYLVLVHLGGSTALNRGGDPGLVAGR